MFLVLFKEAKLIILEEMNNIAGLFIKRRLKAELIIVKKCIK